MAGVLALDVNPLQAIIWTRTTVIVIIKVVLVAAAVVVVLVQWHLRGRNDSEKRIICSKFSWPRVEITHLR